MNISDDERNMVHPNEPLDCIITDDWLKLIFNKCCDRINMLAIKKLDIEFKLGFDEEKIGALADENGEPFVEIQLSYFRALEKFYKTAFNNGNNLYNIISAEKVYDSSKAYHYIVFMMELSMEIIMLHELGHIFNAHLLFKKKTFKNSKATIDENSDVQINEKIIVQQAMEWDADMFAAFYIIGIYAFDEAVDRVNIEHNNLIKGREHMLFMIYVASIIAFSVFGMGRKVEENKDYKEKIHLPLRFRVIEILRNEVKAFNENNEQNLQYSDSDFIDIIMSIEKWVDLYMHDIIKANNWDINNNNDELDESHINYYNKVKEYMENNLEQNLKEFNRYSKAINKGKIFDLVDIMRKIAKEDDGECIILS